MRDQKDRDLLKDITIGEGVLELLKRAFQPLRKRVSSRFLAWNIQGSLNCYVLLSTMAQ
jgi:hypothetical protein